MSIRSAAGGVLCELYKSREDMRKAARRRSYAIHGYCGPNGGGKSAAMVHDTVPSLRGGRPVLSTVRLLDFDNPHQCGDEPFDRCYDSEGHELGGIRHLAAHPLWVPFTDWNQLLDPDGWRRPLFELLDACEVPHIPGPGFDALADEVTGLASSRDSHAMPSAALNALMQLRRRDVLFRWSAPNWTRADKVIREVTQAVTNCVGDRAVDSVSDDHRLWRDRRLLRWRTFDAYDFDEFSSHKRDEMRHIVAQWFWRPGSLTERAYDTYDAVLSLSHVDDSGRCATCSGRRQPRPCSCPEYVQDREQARETARRAAAALKVPA